ncbi:MAG: hypothetical protein HC890_08930 [Chloroflexaceae bacterium]|nr:hypothetical protein [Chloroflexaceae bacterium]
MSAEKSLPPQPPPAPDVTPIVPPPAIGRVKPPLTARPASIPEPDPAIERAYTINKIAAPYFIVFAGLALYDKNGLLGTLLLLLGTLLLLGGSWKNLNGLVEAIARLFKPTTDRDL